MLTFAVAASPLISHMQWGEDPSLAGIEGQKAFGLLGPLFSVGESIAMIYLFVGSIFQYFYRYRLSYSVAFDIVACIAAIGLCIWIGVTFSYVTVE
ncbi:MAG: hypothetical protein K8U03_26220 [Planctomycetia bacterium]|nr:hypothetical protein [Planctomycetia bacterium]